jgi:restriction system protein
MAIPKYDEIQVAALDELGHGKTLKKSDLEAPLAQHFELTEQELQEEYASGNGRIFPDRISWALSYLRLTGLVDRPKRGHYRITDLGRSLIGKPTEIKAYVTLKIAEREAAKNAQKAESGEASQSTSITENLTDTTPQEALYNAADSIRLTICEEILNTVLSKTPRAFEHLVAQLLHRMGYGGSIKGSATVTQYTNDGGIDGVIKEDILGLGRIHIQAKRYAPNQTIGRQDIQNFVGALAVAQSNKGVFITTSSFSKGAVEYVNTLNGATTVVLIDGQQLANYIYDHSLGMQDEQTIVIRRLDGDFWDQFTDDIALA